eukprot:g40544.t1
MHRSHCRSQFRTQSLLCSFSVLTSLARGGLSNDQGRSSTQASIPLVDSSNLTFRTSTIFLESASQG